MNLISINLLLEILLISLLLTLGLIPILSKIAPYIGAVDIPTQRKVHTKPIPRIGGVAIAIATIFTELLLIPLNNNFIKAYLIAVSIIVIFGFIDDIVELNYKYKFLAQITATCIIILYGNVKIVSLGDLLPYDICLNNLGSFLLTFFLILGVTNAINFADGLDGLASGICMLSFLYISYWAYKTNMIIIFIIAVSMAAAILGFLRFNSYPATIFMGDSGSQLLGFSGIVLSIKLTQQSNLLSPVLPLIIFGFPILDTLSVITQRIYEGRSPFSPDKNHFHHKLLKLGLYHTEAVTLIYIIHGLFIIFALLFYSVSDRLIFLSYLLISFFVLLIFFVTEKYNLKLKRYTIISNLKSKLKVLKDKDLTIKTIFFSFKIILYFITTFMVVSLKCLSWYELWLFGILFFIIICGLYSQKVWVFKLGIYLSIPILVWYCNNSILLHNEAVKFVYEVSYILLIIGSILTLKFTRRQKGFKLNPTDCLVGFIVFFSFFWSGEELGNLLYKIIVLFYGYEVLIGELRGEVRNLSYIFMLLFLVLTVQNVLYIKSKTFFGG